MASKHNHNRVHLGYHYPRSDATAKECNVGILSFLQEFEEAVSWDHEKIYATVTDSTENFVDFCDRMCLPIIPIDVPSQLLTGIDAAFTVPEPLFDYDTLYHLVWAKLRDAKVNVLLSSRVSPMEVDGDFIVEATYAALTLDDVTKEVVTIPHTTAYALPHRMGITVMDGPYAGFMPLGRSNDIMVYHVEASRQTDDVEEIVQRSTEFFPFLADETIIGQYQTTRVIENNMDDARHSELMRVTDNHYKIFSGKVTTCMEIGYLLEKML